MYKNVGNYVDLNICQISIKKHHSNLRGLQANYIHASNYPKILNSDDSHDSSKSSNNLEDLNDLGVLNSDYFKHENPNHTKNSDPSEKPNLNGFKENKLKLNYSDNSKNLENSNLLNKEKMLYNPQKNIEDPQNNIDHTQKNIVDPQKNIEDPQKNMGDLDENIDNSQKSINDPQKNIDKTQKNIENPHENMEVLLDPNDHIYDLQSKRDKDTDSSNTELEDPNNKKIKVEAFDGIQEGCEYFMGSDRFKGNIQNMSKPEQDIILIDLSWLPDYFNLTEASRYEVTGYVSTYNELNDLLDIHSKATYTYYLSRNMKDKDLELKRTKRILTQCKYMDLPYLHTVDKYKMYTCYFGGRHIISTKQKTTKDVRCPARIRVCEITKYTEYPTNRLSKRKLELLSKNLKTKQCLHQPVIIEKILAITLPLKDSHQNHSINSKNKYIQRRIHPDIERKIFELVEVGHRTLQDIKPLLIAFVKKDLCSNAKEFNEDNTYYFPHDQSIRKKIRQAKIKYNIPLPPKRKSDNPRIRKKKVINTLPLSIKK